MKSFRFICLILALCTAATWTIAQDKPAPPPVAPAPIAEHDRLVQAFMAERAKLVEARKELKAQAKKARTEQDTKSLKETEAAQAALEKDFVTRNAELIRQIKAKEEEKKGPALNKPKG